VQAETPFIDLGRPDSDQGGHTPAPGIPAPLSAGDGVLGAGGPHEEPDIASVIISSFTMLASNTRILARCVSLLISLFWRLLAERLFTLQSPTAVPLVLCSYPLGRMI
jgi:hypothetical protein